MPNVLPFLAFSEAHALEKSKSPHPKGLLPAVGGISCIHSCCSAVKGCWHQSDVDKLLESILFADGSAGRRLSCTRSKAEAV